MQDSFEIIRVEVSWVTINMVDVVDRGVVGFTGMSPLPDELMEIFPPKWPGTDDDVTLLM